MHERNVGEDMFLITRALWLARRRKKAEKKVNQSGEG
jgi:hypothetical protein